MSTKVSEEQVWFQGMLEEAGATLLARYREQGYLARSEKEPKDIVSELDLLIGEQLCEKIVKAYPKDKIQCEDIYETTKSDTLAPGSRVWIVDPVDGTTNIVKGLPFFAISISCYDPFSKNSIISGIYAPALSLKVVAYMDGVWLDNRSCSVSSTRSVGDALVLYGLSKNIPPGASQFNAVNHISSVTLGTRRTGSAALDLAFVASGMADAYFHYKLNAWDIAAGAHIVSSAGGKISNIGSQDLIFNEGTVLASNGALHSKLNQELSRYKSS